MSEQAASLIPKALVASGVKDDRQQAFAQIFSEALAGFDVQKLVMTDPMTVDAGLLPFVIREFGAQDFIDPDLPEHVQRRILKSFWNLKALHGYDAGVKLGLSLLGIGAEITHWHQTVPRGRANTHTVIIDVGEKLYAGANDVFLGDREVRAALRMIDACKRWSQRTTLYVGVDMKLPRHRTIPVARYTTCAHFGSAIAQRPSSLKVQSKQAAGAGLFNVVRTRARITPNPAPET